MTACSASGAWVPLRAGGITPVLPPKGRVGRPTTIGDKRRTIWEEAKKKWENKKEDRQGPERSNIDQLLGGRVLPKRQLSANVVVHEGLKLSMR